MAELDIEVVHARPERQVLLKLKVPAGTCLRAAVVASGLSEAFPDLDLSSAPLGIFGKRINDPEQHQLEHGDRIEVYRPLLADPKDVRKRRAQQAAQARR